MSFSLERFLIGLAAVLVPACLMATTMSTATAEAKNYHAFLCEIPYGPNAGAAAPTDDVTYYTSGVYSQGGSNCGGGNGEMMTRMDGAVEHPANGAGSTRPSPLQEGFRSRDSRCGTTSR